MQTWTLKGPEAWTGNPRIYSWGNMNLYRPNDRIVARKIAIPRQGSFENSVEVVSCGRKASTHGPWDIRFNRLFWFYFATILSHHWEIAEAESMLGPSFNDVSLFWNDSACFVYLIIHIPRTRWDITLTQTTEGTVLQKWWISRFSFCKPFTLVQIRLYRGNILMDNKHVFLYASETRLMGAYNAARSRGLPFEDS